MADLDYSSSSGDDGYSVAHAVLSLAQDVNLATHACPQFSETLFDAESGCETDFSVNVNIGKIERLNNLISGHASIFRITTGFTLSEWERFTQLVCPVILFYARHTGELKVKQGRPPKLNPAERLLFFVLYTKHNNTERFEAVNWNYSRTSFNSDGAFIASAINVALADEIKWPDENRRQRLSKVLSGFAGCIGHIDGTLCRILRPKIPEHKKYYNIIGNRCIALTMSSSLITMVSSSTSRPALLAVSMMSDASG